MKISPAFDAERHRAPGSARPARRTPSQMQLQLDNERSMLEMLATGAPLPRILDTLVQGFEAIFTGMRCAISAPVVSPMVPRSIGVFIPRSDSEVSQ